MSRPSLDCDLLSSSDLFQGVPGPALAAMRAQGSLRQVPVGSIMLNQGDEPSHLYLVLSGCFKLGHVTPNGAHVGFGYAGPGELVGCVAVLRPMPYPISAKAVEPSSVIGWTSQQIETLFQEHPALTRNALRIMCGRVDTMLQRLRELATEQVEQRVARTLRRVLMAPGQPRLVPNRTPPLSRQDLAELTGATHFTISRIMSAWEQRGIIESRRQRVVVRDPARLTIIAEGGRPN